MLFRPRQKEKIKNLFVVRKYYIYLNLVVFVDLALFVIWTKTEREEKIAIFFSCKKKIHAFACSGTLWSLHYL